MNTDVVLQRHQLVPSEHLAAHCQQQHGLLLFHFLGSGKTLTSLAFAENFPERPKLLILPDELKLVWVTELEKLGVSSKQQKTYTMVGYNQLFTYFKNHRSKPLSEHILIMDEVHNFVQLLHVLKEKSRQKAFELFTWLQGSFRCLLLSGTPFTERETDIAFLINMAAGKTVVPYREQAFRKLYYNTSVLKSFFLGWFFPIYDTWVPFIIWNALHFTPIFRWIAKVFTVAKYGLDVSIAPTGYVKALFGTDINVSGRRVFGSLLLPSLVPSLALMAISRLVGKLNLGEIRNFKGELLAQHIKPYISYYAMNKDVVASGVYPKNHLHVEVSEYDDFQIKQWLDLTLGRSTSEILKQLERGESASSADMFGDVLNEVEYKDTGRIIGNLDHKQGKETIYSPKFHAMLKIMQHGKSKGQVHQTVIYSNFAHGGMHKVSAFLSSQKIKHHLFLPSTPIKYRQQLLLDFKAEKFSVIVLHPQFTEGISIHGARQLHILEPILLVSKLQQLQARVVRYKSHEHLPVQDQHVHIYQWYASVVGLARRAAALVAKHKEWIRNDAYTVYWKRYKRFEQDFTPDALVLMETDKKLSAGMELTVELNKGTSIEGMAKQFGLPNCQIWTPGTKQPTSSSCGRQLRDINNIKSKQI